MWGSLFVYWGVYVADRSGTKIKKIIRGLIFKQFIKSRTINQIYSLIVDAEELQKDFSSLNNYPKNYINFKDCMLDMQTMKKLPHNPAYFSINQIPFFMQMWKRQQRARK